MKYLIQSALFLITPLFVNKERLLKTKSIKKRFYGSKFNGINQSCQYATGPSKAKTGCFTGNCLHFNAKWDFLVLIWAFVYL